MSRGGESIEDSLALRDALTEAIKNDPYSIDLRIQRCKTYGLLGYPDLAIMDAYKALLLVDEVVDDSCEYHEPAVASFRAYMHSKIGDRQRCDTDNSFGISARTPSLETDGDGEIDDDTCARHAEATWRTQLILFLSNNLAKIGCLRPAYGYAEQLLRSDSGNVEAEKAMHQIRQLARTSSSKAAEEQDELHFNSASLPEQGRVRREVYPWNHHEEDRNSDEALDLLNHELRKVAPKLEVRVTELPFLTSEVDQTPGCGSAVMIKQLGVFATSNIEPGEDVLIEKSLLTGNSRLHEPLCDACSSLLPSLNETVNGDNHGSDNSRSLIPCSECDDVIFCSQNCHDLAQEQYHPATCGMDVDAIAKEVPPSKAADSLYTLLLFRSLAMASTQTVHPLDLKEVKYIWGDFITPLSTDETDIFSSAPRALPFSFEDNILAPLHMLEMMEVDIFDTPHELSELWVWNTLYAKFRGTASARISPRDGRPEVAAVHPFWCLANHSCDPNVQWEWAGEIRFTARKKRIEWTKKNDNGAVTSTRVGREGGIDRGQEVFNHYVDIELPVQSRREWGSGALGGLCMCERCIWESSDSAA